MSEAAQSAQQPHTCAHCKGPARLGYVCPRCKVEVPAPGGLYDVLGVEYCSSTCRKADWRNHWTFCKAKQAEIKAREAQIEQAPSGPPCTVCNKLAALPCASCKNAPFPTGEPIPLKYYCSDSCADTDRPNHEAFCLKAKDRKALFKAAEALQREYYIACEMDLKEALQTGLNSNHMIHYNRQNLQQRVDSLRGDENSQKAFLACFGGNNPMLSGRYLMTKHLQGLGVNIIERTIRMRDRVRAFAFVEQGIPAIDRHQVFDVRLRNGEVYALDIFGAQFRLYTTIQPSGEYLDNVRQIEASTQFVYAHLPRGFTA